MVTETLTQNQSISQPRQLAGSKLYLQLLLFFTIRTVMNSGFRMVYPFLPAISRSLGVTETSVTLGITLRSALGLFSPIVASALEGWGRKRTMMMGLYIFFAAMMLVFVSPTYPALIAALILTTLSKNFFDPAMYAYLGERVPYRQRGLAVGIAEFGWSGAFLIGIPIAGFLIARSTIPPAFPFFSILSTHLPLVRVVGGQTGWATPFPILALAAFVSLSVLLFTLSEDKSAIKTLQSSLGSGLRTILTNSSAMAALAISMLITGSNEVVNIVYGSWMENSFALQVAAIGLASGVIGIAELSGEGLVAGFVDRIGKRRAVAIGLSIYILMCLVLPILGNNFGVQGALLGLFLFFLSFEFTLVSVMPLMTELAPSARATLMATNGAGHSLGRIFGSLVGPILFHSGIGANALVSAGMNVLALVLLIWLVNEHAGEKS